MANNHKIIKSLINSLEALDNASSESGSSEHDGRQVWEKPYDFQAPDDGLLRFRDLAIGEQFHFMGSWPGNGRAPGYRTYTKVSTRRFSFQDGDHVTVSTVRGDLIEVARAV